MAKKARVLEWGRPTSEFVIVEVGATVGATLGLNLWNRDGSLVTAAQLAGSGTSNFTLAIAYGHFVPLTRTISTTAPLAGGGALTNNLTLTHNNTAVTPGTYTNATVTVDQKGHVTFAESGSGGGLSRGAALQMIIGNAGP